jgi:hypothetical protein
MGNRFSSGSGAHLASHPTDTGGFLAFYGTQKFIAVLTRAFHQSLFPVASFCYGEYSTHNATPVKGTFPAFSLHTEGNYESSICFP